MIGKALAKAGLTVRRYWRRSGIGYPPCDSRDVGRPARFYFHSVIGIPNVHL